jgi:hypothetical protein
MHSGGTSASYCADANAQSYELQYISISEDQVPWAFPCDAAGWVDMDRLSDALRNRYLYARALVDWMFSRPVVREVSCRQTGKP